MKGATKEGGRLIAVVGPSGVGKDSVMAGMCTAKPDLYLVRRVITRAPDLGGEAYDAVSVSAFQAMVASGAFAVHWGAHGLHYGIPATVSERLNAGTDCIANFSRSALTRGAEAFPNFQVLNITAKPDTLSERLMGRGRETRAEIEKRIAQADKPLPDGLNVRHLDNDRPLEQTVARALTLIQQEVV